MAGRIRLGRVKDKILVIGAGSWGTAVANYLTHKYEEVKIWAREEEVVRTILTEQINVLFLPGKKLSSNLIPVTNLQEEVKQAEILIFAVPSNFIRGILQSIDQEEILKKTLVNLSKGFESTSLKRISEIGVDLFGKEILKRWITLSGPSFAQELANNFPTTVVIASDNQVLLKKIQNEFSSDILRIYISDDLKGVEIAGSLKNIFAIASGIINGLGYAYNTTASLITRAIVEISRFGEKLGTKKDTFWGLAGIGDLMLTSFGPLSRNFQLGKKIAEGQTLQEIQNSTMTVAEGVETTRAIKHLAEKLSIDMPITNAVFEILFKEKNPRQAIKELMGRKLKTEWNID